MLGAQIVIPSTSISILAQETSDHLEDLKRQRENLESESSQIESNIQDSRKQMDNLSKEKKQLQSDINAIQSNVDQLIQEIETFQTEIQEKESEIERLHNEILELTSLIDKRTEKIENQARAVQVSADANSLINILLSSDSFTDLLDRTKLISDIVSSNQSIIGDQKRDQEALQEKEAQAKAEQAELEETKQSLEVSQNNLVNQRLALEERVSQVSADYDLSEEEVNSLIGKQNDIKAKTSELDAQVEAEQKRIEQERIEQEREEAERRQREEQERQRKEEQARKEAADQQAKKDQEFNQRKEQAAQERAAQEERESSQAQDDNQTASSSDQSSNSSENVKTYQATTPTPAPQSSGWIRPASGYISSGFGYRIHPVYGTRRFHAGVDYAGSGTIRATRAGTVTAASYSGGLGYYVRISHGNGMSSVYGHMQPGLHVAPGQHVAQGQSLGIMGATGTSTGVHLHFEIHQNGVPVNPLNYVR